MEPRFSARRYWGWLVGIVVVGMCLRAFSFGWYYGGDDQRWVTAASSFGHPEARVLRSVYYERILWNALLWAWGQVFGMHLEGMASLVFLLSAGTTLLVARAAREWFNDPVSLLAAFLFTIHPNNVVNDVQALPDSLSVFFLAAELAAFSRLTKSLTFGPAAAAGFFVVLAFSAKVYYLMTGIGFLAILATAGKPVRSLLGVVAAYGVGAAVAFGLSTGLCYFDSGHLFPYFDHFGGYRDIMVKGAKPDDRALWRQVVLQVLDRLQYAQWLFVDPGFFSGLVGLLGYAAVCLRAFKDRRMLVLGSIIVVMSLFLLFMPVNLNPFTFVSSASRYLTVILVPLCIASAAVVWDIAQRLKSGPFTKVAWLVCGVCLIDSLIAPNDYAGDAYSRRYSMEIQALRPILVSADEAQVQTIIFPVSYRERLPDSFYKLGPKLEFADMVEPEEFEPWVEQPIHQQLRDRLIREPGTRMYIPRVRSTEWLVWQAYAAGGYKSLYERDATIGRFIEPAVSDQFQSEFVRIPGTAFRQWLQSAGIRTQGVLVGWLVRAKSPNE